MDNIQLIEKYNIPKGSIIFINYYFSITRLFNPSKDKHVAIYYGKCNNTIHLNYCNINDPFVIEATCFGGVRTNTLDNFFKNNKNFKIYVLQQDPISLLRMSIAADTAFDFVGTPYGFGSDSLYCFKLIADCYKIAGIETHFEHILGKEFVLSQSFTKNAQWKKIYDSSTSKHNIVCS
ncbi:NLpc [Cetacean poxvirus 1]|nr:NLpc [Cetacean poxvirus 1]